KYTLPLTSFQSFFFLVLPRPPISTLFPYTTLFRSRGAHAVNSSIQCALEDARGAARACEIYFRDHRTAKSFANNLEPMSALRSAPYPGKPDCAAPAIHCWKREDHA